MAHLFGVDSKGALALAIGTIADLHLPALILKEWAKYASALETIKLDVFQLREDTCTTCDNSFNPNELVEVSSSKVP